MKFKEYLLDKKIDPAAFAKGDPDRFASFAKLFGQMHPDSFTMQKLFLINGIRRSYPLPADQWVKSEKRAEAPATSASAKPVPKMAPKMPPAGNKPARPVIKPKPIIKKK